MDATLRLAKGASAELSSGGIRVHLTSPGTYKLSEAFEKAKGRSGSSSAIAKVLKLAGRNDFDLSTSSTAGVRGEAAGPSSVSWVEDEDEQDPYAPVRASYQAGDYVKASEQARNLRLSTAPAAAFRSAFWDAASLLARGLAVPALRILEQAVPDRRAPESRDAELLTARIYMELAEWNQALDRLGRYVAGDVGVEDRQMALILSSVCREALGDRTGMRRDLESAVSLDPASPLGQEASARMGR